VAYFSSPIYQFFLLPKYVFGEIMTHEYCQMLLVVVVMAVTRMCIVPYSYHCPTGELLHLPAQGIPVKTEQKLVAVLSSPTSTYRADTEFNFLWEAKWLCFLF
jgi:hypothetical protein